MKFVCASCSARYEIPDDKVQGRILRIRCRRCAHINTVSAPDAPQIAPAAPAPTQVDWYYALEGQSWGPYGEDELVERMRDGRVGPDTYVWHGGIPQWVAAVEIPVFQSAIALARRTRQAQQGPGTVALDAVDLQGLTESDLPAPAARATPRRATVAADAIAPATDAIAAEAARRAQEEAKAAEAERRAQEEAKAAEAEKRAQEEAKAAEAEKRAQEEAKAAEAERRAQEEAKAAERIAEARRARAARATPSLSMDDLRARLAPAAPVAQPAPLDLPVALAQPPGPAPLETAPADVPTEPATWGDAADADLETALLPVGPPAAAPPPDDDATPVPGARSAAPEVAPAPTVASAPGAAEAPALPTTAAGDPASSAPAEADPLPPPEGPSPDGPGMAAAPAATSIEGLEASAALPAATAKAAAEDPGLEDWLRPDSRVTGPQVSLSAALAQVPSPPPRRRTGVIVGVGLGVVAIVGVGIFSATRGTRTPAEDATVRTAVPVERVAVQAPAVEGSAAAPEAEAAPAPPRPDNAAIQLATIRSQRAVRSAQEVAQRAQVAATGWSEEERAAHEREALAAAQARRTTRGTAEDRGLRTSASTLGPAPAADPTEATPSSAGGDAVRIVRGPVGPVGQNRAPAASAGPGADHFRAVMSTEVRPALDRCAQRHRAQEGELPIARVTVTMIVQPDGSVSSVTLDRELRGTYFLTCVEGSTRRWRFAPFEGSAQTLVRPFILQ
jgi:predicted Zn finger-like uncharacterized protein